MQIAGSTCSVCQTSIFCAPDGVQCKACCLPIHKRCLSPVNVPVGPDTCVTCGGKLWNARQANPWSHDSPSITLHSPGPELERIFRSPQTPVSQMVTGAAVALLSIVVCVLAFVHEPHGSTHFHVIPFGAVIWGSGMFLVGAVRRKAAIDAADTMNTARGESAL